MKGELNVQAGRGYEGTLAAAFKQHGIRAAWTDFFFVKVRQSGQLKEGDVKQLCGEARSSGYVVRKALNEPGRAWLRQTLSRIEDKLRPPGVTQCLTALPPSTFSFAGIALQDAPLQRYQDRGSLTTDQAACWTPGSPSLHSAQRALSLLPGPLRNSAPLPDRPGELSVHARRAYEALRSRRVDGYPMPATCDTYTPSGLEEAWANAWKRWEARRTPVTREVLCELDRKLGVPRHPLDASTLQCGAKRLALEPLVGLLRNPAYPCWNDTLNAALNPGYLWLDGIPPLEATARSYLLDMGASTWTGGGPGEVEVGASATHWLLDLFAQYGVAFDGILAWEATPHSSSKIWGKMPIAVRARTSYYNIPISDNVSSPSHPWRHLLEIARPMDFVVVKLDVDQPAIEASLIQQLLEDPAIHSRIDVLLWEQHWSRATTSSKPACSGAAELCLAPGFHRKKRVGSYEHTFLSKTFETFTALRRLGVLAHYWY